MKAFFSKLNFKAPAWVNVITAIISILGTMYFGTTSIVTIPGKNGSEFKAVVQSTAIPVAIESCNLKKVGDTCTVKSEVDVEMTKTPTVAEEVKPVAAPVAAPVVEPKSVIQSAPDADAKPVLAEEVKPEEVKPDVDSKK